MMTPIVLMTAALLLQTNQTGAPPVEEPFTLSLNLTKGERSKDSNQQQFAIEILDNIVHYSGAVGPCERGQCGQATLEFDLKAEERQDLLRIIEDDQLLDEFEEVNDTSGLGHFVSGTLVITIGERTATTHVQGMVNSWLKDVKLLENQGKADALVEIAETFFRRATGLTRPSHQ